jgi:hypothetical protein
MSHRGMAGMRETLLRSVRNRKKLEAFLDSGAWVIGRDRVLTRKALVECLLWLPDLVVDTLLSDVPILVIASEVGMPAIMAPFGAKSLTGFEVRFQVLVFDHRLESCTYDETLAAVQRMLSHAFARLAGMDDAAVEKLEQTFESARRGSFTPQDELFLKAAGIGLPEGKPV